jgi:hypothetical protein
VIHGGNQWRFGAVGRAKTAAKATARFRPLFSSSLTSEHGNARLQASAKPAVHISAAVTRENQAHSRYAAKQAQPVLQRQRAQIMLLCYAAENPQSIRDFCTPAVNWWLRCTK